MDTYGTDAFDSPVSKAVVNSARARSKIVVEGLGLMGMAVARKFRSSDEILCFVTSNEKRAGRLQGCYQYNVTSAAGTFAYDVCGVEAVCTKDPNAHIQAYRDACMVVVALHPHGITDPETKRFSKRLAPIAVALAARFTDPEAEPLLFVLISNDRDPAVVFMAALRQAVETQCTGKSDLRARIYRNIHISGAVTEQRAQGIAGAFETADARPLVETEPDMEILLERACCFDESGDRVENAHCASFISGVRDVRTTDNFAAYKALKLFASNGGHLYVAVHASIAGLKTIDQGMADDAIRQGLERLLDNEIYPCLRSKYPGVMSDDVVARHRAALFRRFAESCFSDSVARVRRNIQEKLGADERLVGALTLCLRYGIDAPELRRAIAAALYFCMVGASDSEAAGLRMRLKMEGPEKTLAALSGLAAQTRTLKGPARTALRAIVAEFHRFVSQGSVTFDFRGQAHCSPVPTTRFEASSGNGSVALTHW